MWTRGKSQWLKKFVRYLARCGRTINALLETELALPEPSWQEQQECTQINNEMSRNTSDDNIEILQNK